MANADALLRRLAHENRELRQTVADLIERSAGAAVALFVGLGLLTTILPHERAAAIRDIVAIPSRRARDARGGP